MRQSRDCLGYSACRDSIHHTVSVASMDADGSDNDSNSDSDIDIHNDNDNEEEVSFFIERRKKDKASPPTK